MVLAEYAQLVPDRTLIVTRKAPTSLSVAVKGTGVYKGTWLGAGTSEVEALIEQRQAGPADELAWSPIPSSTVALQPHEYSALTTTWVGDVTLPDATPGKYRLVVKEYERYAVDKPADETLRVGTIAAQQTTERRIVYADALVLW